MKGSPGRQGYGYNTGPVTKDRVKSLRCSRSYHLKVLQGNRDSVHTEGRILDPPIIARFIKINVKTHKGRPSLRMELYGGSNGM